MVFMLWTAFLPIVPLLFLLPDGYGRAYTGPKWELLDEADALEEDLLNNEHDDGQLAKVWAAAYDV